MAISVGFLIILSAGFWVSGMGGLSGFLGGFSVSGAGFWRDFNHFECGILGEWDGSAGGFLIILSAGF